MGKGKMITKHYECKACEAEGKITVKGDDHNLSDIVYCPVCSGDIYEEEEFDDEE
jgi:excinuclease UvrABC ATPase subunit